MSYRWPLFRPNMLAKFTSTRQCGVALPTEELVSTFRVRRTIVSGATTADTDHYLQLMPFGPDMCSPSFAVFYPR